MKITALNFLFFALLGLAACQKDESLPEPPPVDGTKPSGKFSPARQGTFNKQNGYNAEGTAQIGKDEAANQWLRLANDFNASLSTGAVTVYLSKNQNLDLNAKDSHLRVDLVKTPGEHFYKIMPEANDAFKFAILWCASANVQFGNAELK